MGLGVYGLGNYFIGNDTFLQSGEPTLLELLEDDGSAFMDRFDRDGDFSRNPM